MPNGNLENILNWTFGVIQKQKNPQKNRNTNQNLKILLYVESKQNK